MVHANHGPQRAQILNVHQCFVYLASVQNYFLRIHFLLGITVIVTVIMFVAMTVTCVLVINLLLKSTVVIILRSQGVLLKHLLVY